MRRSVLALAFVAMLLGVAWAQETPRSLAASYGSLADTIIALKQAEADLVRAVLDHHLRAAEAAMQRGDHAVAAAEIALFANEGDNAIGGVRKRLVDAGHHHHAADTQGEYEAGYLVVSIAAKQEILTASAALRRAGSDSERQQAWGRFETTATELLATK